MTEGLMARLSAIPGHTPKGVLDSPLILPAILGNLDVTEEAQHNEYMTVAAGQFSQGAQGGTVARTLRSTELEAITLAWDADWLIETGLTDEEVRGKLAQILRSKKPVELLLTLDEEGDPELRMDVTFRSMRRTLRTQENDTRYYSIGIKEWRDPSVERRGSTQSAKPGIKFPHMHPLVAGDSLASLAEDFYGSASHWRAIRDANGITTKFGQSTPLVSLGRYKVGSKIKLPKLAPVKR